MSRFLYILLLLLTLSTPLRAARATSGYYFHTQPDGTQVEVCLVGDEHAHFYLTRQGMMMLKDRQTLYVPDGATQRALRQRLLTSSASSSIQSLRYRFPCTGSPRVAVILAEFTDTVFSIPNPRIVFDRYLNSPDLRNDDSFIDSVGVKRNMGSVRQYFSEMSFGQFTPQFDVYGPVRLSRPLAYYGASDYISLLCRDACAAMDDEIDFSLYDSDSDGEVDLVYIIAAGYSESFSQNSSDCLWPQVVWGISGGTYDGCKVPMAGVSCELHGYPGAFSKAPVKRCSAIGLFVHEFSHALGLPDLYPTTLNAARSNYGLEDWDVMDGGEYKDNGGYTPPPYTAYERQALGWFTIDTLREEGDYTLAAPVDEGGKAYCIMADDTDIEECYILENVQNRGWGWWGSSSAYEGKGHGLLVVHAYNAAREFVRGQLPNNRLGTAYTERGKTLSGADTTYTRYRMNAHYHCLPADSVLISSYWKGIDYYGRYYTDEEYRASMMSVPFPGPLGVTELNATTRSRAWIYQGDGLMHKALSEISETAGGEVSFRFTVESPGALPAVRCREGGEAAASHAPACNLLGIPVGDSYRGWVVTDGKVRLRK